MNNPSLSTLRKFCEEAKKILAKEKYIAEFEVYASSHSSSIGRICYTSHIPSNGLEEPKNIDAQGYNLRVVIREEDRPLVGQICVYGDFSIESLRGAIKQAREAAIYDENFKSLPKPDWEKQKQTAKIKKSIPEVSDSDLVKTCWKEISNTLKTIKASKELDTLIKSKKIKGFKDLGIIINGDITTVHDKIAIGSSHFTRVISDETMYSRSFITVMIESETAKGTGFEIASGLKGLKASAGIQAAKSAIDSIGGKRLDRKGKYSVVLGPQPVKDIWNYLVLPSLNVFTFYAGSSAFMGKANKPITIKGLDCFDSPQDGAIKHSISCDGFNKNRTQLIKDGILTGMLASDYDQRLFNNDPNAKEKLGIDPKTFFKNCVPSNGCRIPSLGGRHFFVSAETMPTNVIIKGKNKTPVEKIIKTIKDGVYIGRIWYTYAINGLAAGDFSSTIIGDSYIIKNGKIVAPLKPNTVRINDNISNILGNIFAFGPTIKPIQAWSNYYVLYTPEIAVHNVHLEPIAKE
ncbi:metallopeptidase TldD-related protein [Elusimicrobiota bacterium]